MLHADRTFPEYMRYILHVFVQYTQYLCQGTMSRARIRGLFSRRLRYLIGIVWR